MIVGLKELTTFDDYATGMRARSDVTVKYTCACKNQLSLENLYYSSSKGKFSLACRQCSSEVIDTYYCPCTLNSFFSSMAFQGKNRCPQCASCPSCGTTLTASARDSGEYLLVCEFCKWSSQDEINLTADSPSALFDKIRAHEDEDAAAGEFDQLLQHYTTRQQLLKEGAKKDYLEPLPYTKNQEWHDVQAAVVQIDSAIADKNAKLWRLPQESVDNATQAGAAGDTNACSIQQRLANLGPPVAPERLWPKLVPLRTKNGRRAPDGGYVIKPKAGANKTSFDIHNLALAVLPRTTLGEVSELKKGEPTKVLLYFKNPLDVPVTFRFEEVDAALARLQQEEQQEEQQKIADEEAGVLDDLDIEEDEDAPEQPVRLVATKPNITASVSVPEGNVPVAALDEIAEQNEIFASADNKVEESDDPAVVGFRKLSKVGVFVEVTPLEDEGPVTCSLIVHVDADWSGSTKEADDISYSSCSFQLEVTIGTLSPA